MTAALDLVVTAHPDQAAELTEAQQAILALHDAVKLALAERASWPALVNRDPVPLHPAITGLPENPMVRLVRRQDEVEQGWIEPASGLVPMGEAMPERRGGIISRLFGG